MCIVHPCLSIARLITTRKLRVSFRQSALALVTAGLMLTTLLWAQAANAQALMKLLYNIKEYAGTGTAGETGANGPALSAELNAPSTVAFDALGNVYIGDFLGHLVHKVDAYGIITTVAGGGSAPSTCPGSTNSLGDGCLATQAKFAGPYDIAIDRAGNIFIGDFNANRVREVVAATGIIHTVVGTGTASPIFTGTTPASGTTVNIHAPIGIALDASDNIYFSDSTNGIIYKATPSSGGAYNVAAFVNATGGNGFSGDGVPGGAANARVNNPIGLTVDQNGNLYIADQYNNRIRKVDSTNTITTVAGNGSGGYSGDNGPASGAEFNQPRGVAIDYTGDLIVADSSNTVVRIIYSDSAGVVTTASTVETLAGGCANSCAFGGLAITASFAAGSGFTGGALQVGFDTPNGTLYIPALNNNTVFDLAPSTTFATTQVGQAVTQTVGVQLIGGAATISQISILPGPGGVQEFSVGAISSQPANPNESGSTALTCSTDGVTSNAAGTVCKISVTFTPAYPWIRTAQLEIATSAGTFHFGLNGIGESSLASVLPGTITTFAGTGTAGNTTNSTAATSELQGPWHAAFDAQGNYYFADTLNNLIRKVTPSGVISTIAGGGSGTCIGATNSLGDGCTPTAAVLNQPHAVAVDSDGDIYLADSENMRVRKISAQTGLITTIAGTGTAGYMGDGGLATAAELNVPGGLAFDANNNLFIADRKNNVVREIGAGSLYIYTYAGTGPACAAPTASPACGDAGLATSATLNDVQDIALDPSGNLIIADSSDNRIRLVNAVTGIISTVAGTGQAGYTDNVAANAATLNYPADIAVDPAGNYYIADFMNNALRQVSVATGNITTLAGNGSACSAPATACGDGGAANAALLNTPIGVVLDPSGNLYISDFGDNEIREINGSSNTFSYVTTPIGSVSTDSPRAATLENIGTQPLTFSIPTASGNRNASISTGFTLDTTANSACPQLSSSSSTATLASGEQCVFSISFAPEEPGSISGSLVETDNSLNAGSGNPLYPAASTQTVNLHGTATKGTAGLTVSSSLNPSVVGQSTAITVTLAPAGTAAGPTASGGIPVTYTPVGSSTALPLGTATATSNPLVFTLSTAALPIGNDTVTATYGGDANYVSGTTGTVTQTVNKIAATSNDSATGTGYYGAATSPVTVSIPYSGSTAPTGGVTINGPGGSTATVAASTCISSSGVLTCTINLPSTALPVGSNTLAVSQAADANYNGSTGSGTLTIHPAAATSADTASGTGTYGAATSPVIVTIPYAGAAAPTGAVTVAGPDSSTATVAASACTASSGSLTCTINFPSPALPLGSNALSVSQAADANYAGSTGSGTLTIGQSSSPLAAAPSSVQNITISLGTTATTLTTTIVYGGSLAPTGAVTFQVGGGASVAATCSTGASPLSCTATYPTSSLSAGTYPISASEAADSHYAAGSAAATLTVENTAPSPLLNNGGSVPNQQVAQGTASVTLTATIPYTGPAPSGAVTFQVAGGSGGTVTGACTSGGSPLTCTASYPMAALAAGHYTITATEAADSNYAQGSGSGTISITSSGALSPIWNTGSGLPDVSVGYGAATAVLSASIVYTSPSPEGAVTLKVAGGSGGSVAAPCTQGSSPLTCSASYPTATLGVGSYTILATEDSDSQYPAGFATGTLTVTAAAASSNDTAAGTGTYGAATAVVTVSIPYAGATPPSGAVTVNGPGGATATVAAATCTTSSQVLTCTVNLPSAALPAGSNSLTVFQAADSNYAVSTGSGTLTLSKAPATTTDTASGSGYYGAATAPVTVIIPYAGAGAPTGAVTVTGPGGSTATVAASTCTTSAGTLNCALNLPSSALPVGASAISVSQAADTNYAGSTGSGTLTIAMAPATTNDSASGTGVYGAATSPVTVTIPYAGVAAPSGAVTVNGPAGSTMTVAASTCTASAGVLTCAANLPSSTLPLGSNALTVSQAADSNYGGSTGSGTLTIRRPSPLASPASSLQNVTVTQGTTMTTLTAIIAYNSVVPTGAVTFTVAGGASETATCSTGPSPLTCTATYPTASLASGNYPIAATEAADANYAAGSGSAILTVETLSPSPLLNNGGEVPNQAITQGASSVTLTATIPYSGPTPTGAVTFQVAGGSGGTVTATCSSGASPITCTAAYPAATLTPGDYTITATEAADDNYAQGSDTGTLSVAPAVAHPGSPILDTGSGVPDVSTGYGTATTGLSVSLVYTGTAPTGAVTLQLAGTGGGALTATCKGSPSPLTCAVAYPTAALGVGSYTILALEAADGTYPGGFTTGTLTVTPAAATTTDTASGTGMYGAPTSPVTVTIPYAGVAAPTGAVTVTGPGGAMVTVAASTCAASTGVLTCMVNLPSASLPAGQNALSVSQAGDSNYTGSTGGGILTLQPNTGNKVMVVPATVTIGYGTATATFTATVTYPGSAAPSGGLTFTVTGGAALAASCSGSSSPLTCTAAYPLSPFGVGTYTITATEGLDANYAAASGTGSLTITSDFTFTNKGTTTFSVLPGGSADYSFALAPVSPYYPGTVTLTVTGCPPGARCTVTPSTEPDTAGPQTIALAVGTAPVAASRTDGARWGKKYTALMALLLPLFFPRRIRKGLGKALCVMALLTGGLVASTGLTGCGQHNGFFGQPEAKYVIAVTASSGGLSRSAAVTLYVQ